MLSIRRICIVYTIPNAFETAGQDTALSAFGWGHPGACPTYHRRDDSDIPAALLCKYLLFDWISYIVRLNQWGKQNTWMKLRIRNVHGINFVVKRWVQRRRKIGVTRTTKNSNGAGCRQRNTYKLKTTTFHDYFSIRDDRGCQEESYD